ncbi:hypothetical protein [Burkholderia ubonensis]|uniref:hypothetical protein n=1 Tax=Burkholderia ubonensis TaxID=101571 RepID=UPI000B0B4EAF|nr:hypothetical protein [Burkholderia ubonensis]
MKQPQSKKPPYSLEKWGSFGTFQSGKSLPVHYLLTTLSLPELGGLTLARKIRQEKIDFQLLMQRDIDIDRVNQEIIKYLCPDPEKTPAEVLSRPLFFPPLLVAVIPVKNRIIQSYLPNETVVQADIEGSPGVRRSWGDIVNLNYFITSEGDTIDLSAADGKTYRCQTAAVQVQIRKPPKNSDVMGAELVVFDGQHRFEALRRLAGTGLLNGLRVPICIVLSPNSTDERHAANEQTTLPVPEVFRGLFVDVNRNAVQVGGHFNTLLSDATVGSIACRIFCESVLEDEKETGLAVVEWNVRSKKDATQIKREYSITSIGVIEQALSKSLSNKRDHWSLLNYVLALDEVAEDLYLKDGETEPERVEWDRFSPRQRRVLEGQIRKRLVKQGLQRIFFEAAEYKRAVQIFRETVSEYQDVIAKHGPDFDTYDAILQEVLEYVPIPESSKAVRASFGVFERTVEGKFDARVNSIARYGIFQRAMIVAWLAIVGRLRSSGDFDFNSITTGFISLLDWALDRERAIFSERKRRYMIHTVFRPTSVIKPSEASRDALTCLLLAALGNKEVAGTFIYGALGKKSPNYEAILYQMGLDAATRFGSHYRRERAADYARSYRADFNLPKEERDELGQLEDRVDDLKRKVREQAADPSDYKTALKEFEVELDKRVSKDVELALAELKLALSYEAEVVQGEIEELDIEES